MCACLTKSEPFLNGIDGARSAAESIGKISESFILVGVPRVELGTSSLSVTRSNQLSYTPEICLISF
ncbi:MAG: hypothetical protein UW11_C0029G0008 [Parcubacteria group bacterium GW2011_GWA2_43_9b]|nr:MAG: hypothetical protein UW11_C0029G0008 [Parcubacteria group bacterium GW2011_GWA2_43_9b]